MLEVWILRNGSAKSACLSHALLVLWLPKSQRGEGVGDGVVLRSNILYCSFRLSLSLPCLDNRL